MNQIINNNQEVRKDQIDVVDKISRKDFYNDYVNKGRPLLIRGMTNDWGALNWDLEYFKNHEEGVRLAVKTGNVSEGKREYMLLSEYIMLIDEYENTIALGQDCKNPGYLHDVPFFYLFPKLVPDIEPFPIELFPKWYHEKWYNYIQFFMGATGSLTPLHFDTLCTNNLFFQIVGKKKFILISEDQKDLCYMRGWRWANFDPSEPDFDKYPLAFGVKSMEVNLSPGDILFIPSGTLHQVHGLSNSISFNIDWHTSKTAKKGMMTLFKGAPAKNVYYNFLSYLGLGLGVPQKYIFPFYKSYLNYVS